MPSNNGNHLLTHCKRGHEFNVDNTYLSGGRRYCRACRLATNRKIRVEQNERIRAYHRDWRAKNPFSKLAWDCRKRARMFGARGLATAEQIRARFALFGDRCWMCGSEWEQIDHVIPLGLRGTNWPANLRPICKSCNLHKAARHPKELVAA